MEVTNKMVSVLVDSAVEGDKVGKEDIIALISEIDDKLSAGDTVNIDDLGYIWALICLYYLKKYDQSWAFSSLSLQLMANFIWNLNI